MHIHLLMIFGMTCIATLFAAGVSKYLGLTGWVKRLVIIISCAIALTSTNIYLYPRYMLWKFTQQYSLFHLISQADPEAYNEFTSNFMTESEHSNAAAQIVAANARHLILTVFAKYLKSARNNDIYFYLKSTIDAYKKLYKISPQLVVDAGLGFSYPKNIFIPTKIFTDTFSATDKMIQGAIKNPQMTPTKNEALPFLKPILISLFEKYGKNTVINFMNGKTNGVPSSEAAELTIDFYQEIYNSGEKSSGVIMRYLGSQLNNIQSPPAVLPYRTWYINNQDQKIHGSWDGKNISTFKPDQ